MRRHKRRQFLIDPLQYHLLLVNLTYFFTIVLVFAAAVFAPTMMDMNSGSWEQRQDAANQFLSLHARIWPAVLVLFALLVAHSVVMSHRIAGPLYRFRRVFSQISEGDLAIRAVIRKRDYLRKEADSINQMIAGLCDKVQSIEAESAELAAIVDAIDEAVTTDSPEARVLLERLGNQAAELRKSVLRFHMKESASHEEQAPLEQEAVGDREPQPIAHG
jgi:methyl-accepting chemotaxis protein